MSLSILHSYVGFCSVVVYLTAASSEDYVAPAQDNGVYVLKQDNFDDFISHHDILLVEFYAPWCGHCKSLAPEYEAAAAALKDNDPPILLGKVDSTTEDKLSQRFGVSGYPTMLFFKDSKHYEYDGGRTKDGIVRFMKEKADPAWQPPKEAVVTLTSTNFTETVSDAALILVEFYAPWCGHCKNLAPIYEKAAKTLRNNDPPIPLAKIDATVAKDLATSHGITAYPTLKVFKKGHVYPYTGTNQEHAIVKYMLGQQTDGSKKKDSLADVKQFLRKDDVTVMGFFETEDDAALKVYLDASNELRDDYSLGHTFDKNALKAYRVNPGSIVVFNTERFYTKYEPKWHVFDKADCTVADIKEFVSSKSIPLVGQYSSENANKRYSMRPLCLVFYTIDWSFDHRDATQMWRRKVVEIANDYRDIAFAVADESDSEDLIKSLGLEESGEEINIGILGKEGRFPMEAMEEFDSDDVRAFLNNFKKGNVKPHIKSQPVPKKNDDPLKVVVGLSFDSIVKDPTKDVLIMLHAPWCQHCINSLPVLKKFAKRMSDEKNLVVAKIDATANDIPAAYTPEGYPTVFFVASNNKDKPVKYEDGITLDAMVKYVTEHATVSVGKSRDEL